MNQDIVGWLVSTGAWVVGMIAPFAPLVGSGIVGGLLVMLIFLRIR